MSVEAVDALTPLQRRAIDLLANEAKPAWQRASATRGICIPATRIACEVLKAAGLAASPVAVDVVYENQAWLDHVAANGEPQTSDELMALFDQGIVKGGILYHARERGIDPALLGEVTDDTWRGGHLVATFLTREGRRYVFDQTIDQCDKPDKDIVFPGTVIIEVPPDWAEGGEFVAAPLPMGQVAYQAWPHDQSYLSTEIWNFLDDPFNVMRAVQATIVKRLREGS